MENKILIFFLKRYLLRYKDFDCWACYPDIPLCDGFTCKAHLLLWEIEDETFEDKNIR